VSRNVGAGKVGPRCRLQNQKVYSKKAQKARTKDAAEPDKKYLNCDKQNKTVAMKLDYEKPRL